MKFLTTDVMAEDLSDPAFRAAYWEERIRTIDPADLVDDDADTVPPGVILPPRLYGRHESSFGDDHDADLADESDDARAEVSDEFDALQDLVRRGRAVYAEQDRLFHESLVRAAADPDFWTGPDPTADPAWQPPPGLTATQVRRRRRDMAVRAAAADIAVRVHLSHHAVRGRAYRAHVLSTRCPATWAAYRSGEVPEQNAATVATLVDTLPADAPDAWAAFDGALSGPATTMAPGRFRIRARSARERMHPESLGERHARAMADRAVSFIGELDGMASFNALIPAAQCAAIDRRLDDTARHLATQDGETRTVAQLRADVLVDLLIAAPAEDGNDAGATGAGIGATVHITIPVMTLLGHDDQPATLDGYGPIDLATARKLAGGSSSWIRVLTHPVTATVLDVDRRSYRVPKALRRWLGVQHPTCIFPGCTRPARGCDIDHRTRWADGGATRADNLGPLCKSEHPIKDETLWSLRRHPETGTLTWTSPTGYTVDADPPPF